MHGLFITTVTFPFYYRSNSQSDQRTEAEMVILYFYLWEQHEDSDFLWHINEVHQQSKKRVITSASVFFFSSLLQFCASLLLLLTLQFIQHHLVHHLFCLRLQTAP